MPTETKGRKPRKKSAVAVTASPTAPEALSGPTDNPEIKPTPEAPTDLTASARLERMEHKLDTLLVVLAIASQGTPAARAFTLYGATAPNGLDVSGRALSAGPVENGNAEGSQ